VVNFDLICSLIPEKFDDQGLLDFRVHRMMNVEGTNGGNAFLREI
jgi:hypothetical protein